MSALSQHGQPKSIAYHYRSRIAGRTLDPLHVALLMHGLAIFISAQVDSQIHRLTAKCAAYFWGGAATHRCLLWRVKTSVGQTDGCWLINTDQVWSFAHEPNPSSIDQTLARKEQTVMLAGFWGCESCAKGELHAPWIPISQFASSDCCPGGTCCNDGRCQPARR